ncbi:MAG TPA: 2-C-methyl-D-erythritol 4-phosphate cytidylyltransferase [Nitrolancea sp.]|nr:2-C-methyl-D-erythritol 4-phosphate cytidylyltransferase [Nitrolancea sp.]
MPSGAVVVAAGRSQRMGFNKTLAMLGGRPILRHVLDLLESINEISEIIVVTSADNFDAVQSLIDERSPETRIGLCLGGDTRQESVERGVAALAISIDLVLIHDAARPLVTADIVREGIRRASESGAAIAAIPVSDTIKMVTPDGRVERTPDRSHLYAAQTPQVFRRDWLEASYARVHAVRETVPFTDEASLLEWAGYNVHTFAGSPQNIKLTHPVDLVVAEAILGWRRGREQ